MIKEQWLWCRDGKHRKCKVERMPAPAAHESRRWAYIVSYYNNWDDWNVWVNYDTPEKGHKNSSY